MDGDSLDLKAGADRITTDLDSVDRAVDQMLLDMKERLMPHHATVGNLQTIKKALGEIRGDVAQLGDAIVAIGNGIPPSVQPAAKAAKKARKR